jgi:hypothetical protein
VRRLISNEQIERDALKAWKKASRLVLKDYVAPKTPYDKGVLRGGLWHRTTIQSDGTAKTTFSSRAWYWFRYETDEAWISTHTLHTSGTRAPFIMPAIEEAEKDGIFEQAVKDMVYGR